MKTSKEDIFIKKKAYKSVIRFMPNFNDTRGELLNNRRKNRINKIFK